MVSHSTNGTRASGGVVVKGNVETRLANGWSCMYFMDGVCASFDIIFTLKVGHFSQEKIEIIAVGYIEWMRVTRMCGESARQIS